MKIGDRIANLGAAINEAIHTEVDHSLKQDPITIKNLADFESTSRYFEIFKAARNLARKAERCSGSDGFSL